MVRLPFVLLLGQGRRCLTDTSPKVMIRPRTGDFLYSGAELEIMKEDVRTFRDAGADGIVIGILQKDGRIDIERTRL